MLFQVYRYFLEELAISKIAFEIYWTFGRQIRSGGPSSERCGIDVMQLTYLKKILKKVKFSHIFKTFY